MGAGTGAPIDRDELERVYERAKAQVLSSMDGGRGMALPSPIDVGLRQHMEGTEYVGHHHHHHRRRHHHRHHQNLHQCNLKLYL